MRLDLIGLALAVGLAACSRQSAPAPERQVPPPAPPAAPAKPMSRFEGTPFAGYDQPSPGLAAKKDAFKGSVKYRNGKIVEDHSPPMLSLVSEMGDDASGVLTVQAYPGDVVYLGATAQTEAGTPLGGKVVTVAPSNPRTRVVLMNDATDKEGYVEFHVLAAAVGKDRIKVSAAGVSQDVILDVQQPQRSEWLGSLDLNGVTSWDVLMKTDVKLDRDRTESQFPPDVLVLADTTIKVVGFMLPLESTQRQKHFLLSANPPVCFFHPPGGPSSVVEVFADRGVEAGFDPMVVEGKLKLVATSEAGVIYQLRNAKLVAQ